MSVIHSMFMKLPHVNQGRTAKQVEVRSIRCEEV